ncbi:transcription factor TamA [Colletotrichum higginsianum]|uniref:Transcription factor TamA n=1 Tax=Colletotrichum higginsianum (strain IMI 349063) TaxID=759273 RepID=H1VKJ8_COLHI|nr:transcription factor TamA [Colletotrichum higginsianum]
MCSFHGQPCTYLRGPLPRKRRKATDPPEHRPSTATNGSVSAPAGPPPAPVPLDPQEEITHPSPELLEALSPSLAGSEHAITFNQPSLLDGTLGLHLKTHSEYVGNTNYREPSLLDLHRPHDPAIRSVRRLDESTVFLIHRDRETSSEPQRIADLDAIEKVVHPLGSTLVNLYFRIVHPSFPVLHKKVFLEKYARSYHEFSPPLLAAVYLLALDWSLYDRTLATSSWQPDQAALEALALRTMSDDMKRPKISTLQAGLLIQQRFRNNTWTFTAQLTALAQGLGLHVDCSDWAIPDWEKGLRRRLAWALFMQDKWGALVHGRPSHIRLDEDWDVRPCCIEDFPENAADEEHDPEGSAEVVVGRELFLRHIELSLILSDVLGTFYTAKATRRGGTLDQIGTVGVAELAKPIVMMLRECTLPPLPAGKELPPNVTATDAISRTLNTLPPSQLLDILTQMKALASSDPARATELLQQAPQLAYAVFQALLLMGLAAPIGYPLQPPAPGFPPVPVPGANNTPPVSGTPYAPPPQQVSYGAPPPPAAGALGQDPDALMRQVMELPMETINMLPEAERQQILALRASFGGQRR